MHIDLKTDLPKVRKAFDDGTLQAVAELNSPGAVCNYKGLCAIGVMMDEATRQEVSQYHGIGHLLDTHSITAPENQRYDLAVLQDLHDDAVASFNPQALTRFGAFLQKLEAKYAS